MGDELILNGAVMPSRFIKIGLLAVLALAPLVLYAGAIASGYGLAPVATGIYCVNSGDGMVGPYGIVSDGQNGIWASNYANGKLTHYDISTGTPTDLGQYGGGLAGICRSEGMLYGALLAAGQIVAINPQSGSITAQVASGIQCPSQIAVDNNNPTTYQDLYFTSTCSGSIYRLKTDGQGGFSLSLFLSGLNGPDGLTIGPDGTIYVATNDGVISVSKANGVSGAVTTLASIPGGANGLALGLGADGTLSMLYISTSQGNLYQLSLEYTSHTLELMAGGLARQEGLCSDIGGCIYLTQPDSILKFTLADGTCPGSLQPSPTPTPSILQLGTPGTLYPGGSSGSAVLSLAAFADVAYATRVCDTSERIYLVNPSNSSLQPFVTLPTQGTGCSNVCLAASAGMDGFGSDLLFAADNASVYFMNPSGVITKAIDLPWTDGGSALITFDRVGTFGGRLIIADSVGGSVWALDARGHLQQLGTTPEGLRDLTVAGAGFTPYGGTLLLVGSQNDRVYSLDASGNLTAAFDFDGIRHIAAVPPAICEYLSTWALLVSGGTGYPNGITGYPVGQFGSASNQVLATDNLGDVYAFGPGDDPVSTTTLDQGDDYGTMTFPVCGSAAGPGYSVWNPTAVGITATITPTPTQTPSMTLTPTAISTPPCGTFSLVANIDDGIGTASGLYGYLANVARCVPGTTSDRVIGSALISNNLMIKGYLVANGSLLWDYSFSSMTYIDSFTNVDGSAWILTKNYNKTFLTKLSSSGGYVWSVGLYDPSGGNNLQPVCVGYDGGKGAYVGGSYPDPDGTNHSYVVQVTAYGEVLNNLLSLSKKAVNSVAGNGTNLVVVGQDSTQGYGMPWVALLTTSGTVTWQRTDGTSGGAFTFVTSLPKGGWAALGQASTDVIWRNLMQVDSGLAESSEFHIQGSQLVDANAVSKGYLWVNAQSNGAGYLHQLDPYQDKEIRVWPLNQGTGGGVATWFGAYPVIVSSRDNGIYDYGDCDPGTTGEPGSTMFFTAAQVPDSSASYGAVLLQWSQLGIAIPGTYQLIRSNPNGSNAITLIDWSASFAGTQFLDRTLPGTGNYLYVLNMRDAQGANVVSLSATVSVLAQPPITATPTATFTWTPTATSTMTPTITTTPGCNSLTVIATIVPEMDGSVNSVFDPRFKLVPNNPQTVVSIGANCHGACDTLVRWYNAADMTLTNRVEIPGVQSWSGFQELHDGRMFFYDDVEKEYVWLDQAGNTLNTFPAGQTLIPNVDDMNDAVCHYFPESNKLAVYNNNNGAAITLVDLSTGISAISPISSNFDFMWTCEMPGKWLLGGIDDNNYEAAIIVVENGQVTFYDLPLPAGMDDAWVSSLTYIGGDKVALATDFYGPTSHLHGLTVCEIGCGTVEVVQTLQVNNGSYWSSMGMSIDRQGALWTNQWNSNGTLVDTIDPSNGNIINEYLTPLDYEADLLHPLNGDLWWTTPYNDSNATLFGFSSLFPCASLQSTPTPVLWCPSVTSSLTPSLGSVTSTWTGTPTATASATPSSSCTLTRTDTPTLTGTWTPTSTPTVTVTTSSSSTRTATFTDTATLTASDSPTVTMTRSRTPSPTLTRTTTATCTRTYSPASTAIHSATPSATFTRTVTTTMNRTATRNVSSTISPTFSYSPTAINTVMPCLAQAVAAGSIVVINNGAMVDGYDSSRGSYGTGNQGLAAGIQAGGTITNNGQVTGSLLPNTASTATPIPSPAVTPLGIVLVNSGQTLTLVAGEYSASSLTINGNGTLLAQGQVRIWVSGAVTVSGTLKSASGMPNDFWIILSGSGPVQVNGGGLVLGVVDAPLANVLVGGTLEGGLVAANVTLNSGASVHFDRQVSCGVSGSLVAALSRASAGKLIRGAKLDRPVVVAPNPCRGQAILWYSLPQASTVQVIIYDIAGEQVYRRWIGQQQAGVWQQSLNLSGMANGVYVLRVLLDGQRCSSCDFKLAVIR
jgi:hypothetical protein